MFHPLPSSVGKENKSGLRSLDEKEVRDARSLREEIGSWGREGSRGGKNKENFTLSSKEKASSSKHNVLDPNAPTFIAKGFFDGPKPGYTSSSVGPKESGITWTILVRN